MAHFRQSWRYDRRQPVHANTSPKLCSKPPTNRWRSVQLGLLCAAALQLSPLSALAQDPNQSALAEELFNRGRALMAADDLPAACAALAESQRLDPAVGTLLNLAVCHERQGRLASAWSEFLQVASAAERDQQRDRAQFARRKADELEPRIQKLELVVPAQVASIQELRIRLDEHELGRAAWSNPIPLDPGEHSIELQAPGYQPHSTKFSIGESQPPLQLQLPPLEAEAETQPEATSQPATAAPPAQQGARGETQRVVGYGLAGAGVVGLGLAGYFGIRAMGHKNDRDRYCDDDNVCSARGVLLDQDARDAASAANVAAAVGAVLIGGGLTILLLSPSEDDSPALAASVNPTLDRSQLVLSGQF